MAGYKIAYEMHGPDGVVVDLGPLVLGGYTGNPVTFGGVEYGFVVEEKGFCAMPWADQLLWRGGTLGAISEAARLLKSALCTYPHGDQVAVGTGTKVYHQLLEARATLEASATRFEIGEPRDFVGGVWTARAVLRAP